MKVCLCTCVILLSWVLPAKGSECSYRLVSDFAFAVVDIQRQREQIKPELSPETLIATPLRLQRTIEESASHFLTTFQDCQFADADTTSLIAGALSQLAEQYKQSVDLGKRSWQIVGVDPSSPAEARKKTRQLQTLLGELAEQQVNMERTDAILPKMATFLLFAITGKHPTDANRIALMLTAEEKQQLLAEIKNTCRGQCVFQGGGQIHVRVCRPHLEEAPGALRPRWRSLSGQMKF
jgi:hypothetical protein